jgi:hypothetical protein
MLCGIHIVIYLKITDLYLQCVNVKAHEVCNTIHLENMCTPLQHTFLLQLITN